MKSGRRLSLSIGLGLLGLLVLACNRDATPDHPLPPPPPAMASPAPSPELCGTQACVAPERCITVVGMTPESARKECWITCAGGEKCPAGMHCDMINDGPGRVCVKK